MHDVSAISQVNRDRVLEVKKFCWPHLIFVGMLFKAAARQTWMWHVRAKINKEPVVDPDNY